jgi:hypothetical protein
MVLMAAPPTSSLPARASRGGREEAHTLSSRFKRHFRERKIFIPHLQRMSPIIFY